MTPETAEPIVSAVTESAPPDVRAVLAAGKPRGIRRWILPVVLVLGAGGGVAWFVLRDPSDAKSRQEMVTVEARRGDLQAIVTATGNLKGLDTVEVGAEINGRIKVVHVDFNDQVKAGQVLCEIDPTQLTANRDQARAQVAAAEAELRNRRATAQEARQTADRNTSMSGRGLVSAQQLETAVAAADRAEASVASAQAQITVARAALSNAETALAKASIKSPMDGVVLSRTVEVGQTVNASMQTPVLFTITKDLRRMELTVAIDEADIGQVKEGQEATFTVDAFPGKTFPATLRLIQNVATVVDNVVTYAARLTVDNDDLVLRPGMTATVNVLTAERKDALLVPNAALRFKPPAAPRMPSGPLPFLGPAGRGMGGSSRGSSSSKAPAEGAAAKSKAPEGATSKAPEGAAPAGAPRGNDTRPTVYVLKGGQAVPVRVTTGLTDGTVTEVTGGDLEAGAPLVTDILERKGG